jgi:hypothetical protein
MGKDCKSAVVDCEHYSSLDTAQFYTAKDLGVAYSFFRRAAVPLPSDCIRVLASCRVFATLPEHAHRVAQHMHFSLAEATRCIEVLVEKGLLVSQREIITAIRSHAREPASKPAVTSLVIPTRNRTDTLRRGLRSFIHNRNTFARKYQIVIADDSERTAAASTRSMLHGLLTTCGVRIHYASIEDREAYAVELAKEAQVPDEIVEFAILNPYACSISTGACRNTLLLATSGEMIVSVDDDTICEIAPVPESEHGIGLSSFSYDTAGQEDPIEHYFYTDFESARDSVEFEQRDFVALHEQLLGRDVADCLLEFSVGESPNLGYLRTALLRNIERRKSGVIATTMGFVGDCATDWPGYMVFLSGRAHERLTRSEEFYRMALQSRQVITTPRQMTIWDGPVVRTMNIGLDNRVLLPPFLPVYRAQDAVFGAILRLCFPETAQGLLPWILVHAPAETRSVDKDLWIPLANLETTARMLALIISSFKPSYGSRDYQDRLLDLARYLKLLGAMPTEEFYELVRLQFLQGCSNWLRKMELIVESSEGKPTYWADDIRKCELVLRTAMLDEHRDIIPKDLAADVGPNRARQMLQMLVCRYGELLECWPTLIASARRLREKGRKIAPALL